MNYQAENLFVRFPPGITMNILLQNLLQKEIISFSARFLEGASIDETGQYYFLSGCGSFGLQNYYSKDFGMNVMLQNWCKI